MIEFPEGKKKKADEDQQKTTCIKTVHSKTT